MSVESMAICLHHSRAKGVARLVLLGIANHDGDGGAWPTLETLAVYAGGVDTRTVRRAVRQLVDLGEVDVEVNGGGTEHTRADRRPNRYTILLGCPAVCDRTSRHRIAGGGTQVSARPVDNFVREGAQASARDSNGRTLVVEREDTPVLHGGTPVSAEPSFNHPEPPARQNPNQRAGGQPVDKPPGVLALEAEFGKRERIKHLAPFHRLSGGDVNRLAALVDQHGASRLADYAAATALTARSWRAFLSDWESMTTPTRSSADEPRCQICNQTKAVHNAPAFNDHNFETQEAIDARQLANVC